MDALAPPSGYSWHVTPDIPAFPLPQRGSAVFRTPWSVLVQGRWAALFPSLTAKVSAVVYLNSLCQNFL